MMRFPRLKYPIIALLAIIVLTSTVAITPIANAQDPSGIALLVHQSTLSRSDATTLQIVVQGLGDAVAGSNGFESITLVMILPNGTGGLGTYYNVVLTPVNASFTYLQRANEWIIKKPVKTLPAGIITAVIIKHHNLGFSSINISLLNSEGKITFSRVFIQHSFESESNVICEIVPVLIGAFGGVTAESSLIALPGGGKNSTRDWAEINVVISNGTTLYSDKLSMSNNEYFEKSATAIYSCAEEKCAINISVLFDISESVTNAVKAAGLGSTVNYSTAIKLLRQGKLPYVALIVIQKAGFNANVIAKTAPIIKKTSVITKGGIGLDLSIPQPEIHGAFLMSTNVDVYLVMVGENKAYVSALHIILLPRFEAEILSNLLTRISTLKSQTSKLIQELQNSIESVQGNVKLLDNNLKALESNVSGIKSEVNSLAVKLSNAKQSIDQLKSTLDESVSKLNTEVNGLNTKINSLSTSLNKLSQKLSDIENSINVIDNTLKQLKEKLSSVNDELSNAENTVANNSASIKTLNTAVGNLNSKVEGLTTTAYVAVGLGALGILLGIIGVAMARRGRA